MNSASATTKIHYFHNDHLGTPQVVTDEDQQVVWRADYRPFGEVDVTIDTLDQAFRFPGQYAEGDAGLYYNYYRDYDPSIGRYVQSDPIGLGGGINTYGYVLQNPLSFTDPDGLNPRVAGRVGYFVGGVTVRPAINWGIRLATSNRSLSLGSWVYDITHDKTFGDDDQSEYYRQEAEACSEMCSDAQCDPNRSKVFGGSMSQFMKNCMPAECGGEPLWKGYIN